MRYQEELTFPLVLERDGAVPLRVQLAGQIAAAISSGAVVSGMRMPSIRTLSEQLGVSRGVIVAAYDILHGQGHLEIRPGAGAFVQASRIGTGHAEVDLTPGRMAVFPIRAWRAAWRSASQQPPSHTEPALRRALSEHLTRVRSGLPATHEIVVTAGFTAGLRLALEAIGCTGPDVAVEEPAAPSLWRTVPGVIALARGGPAHLPATTRAIVLSPDGSFPTGRVLSVRDRLRLAEWSRGGGFLVEIAQDAVLRRDLAGLPRLSDTAARGRVIVVGGFERVLSPALKIGYLLAPREIARAAADLIAQRDEQPGGLLQLATTHLIAGGALARHMHRLTRLHAQKRSIVDSMLSVHGGCLCTALLPVPAGVTAVAAASAAAARGIRVQALDRYHFARGPAEQALVLGYSHLPDNLLRHGLARLSQVLCSYS